MSAKTKEELLYMIDNCTTIAELFEIVRDEHIDMRMQTLCIASNIPPKMLTATPDSGESPMERLRKVVHLAAENQR